jgi:thioredoxin reductase (NADPH)
MDTYDVVVVGGGLAALTAGLFAARYGHTTLVLVADVPGGHLASTEMVADFPGFPAGVAGYELCPAVQEQASTHGAEFRLAAVERLVADEAGWCVVTGAETYRAHAVIIATGSRPRALGLPAEERWHGRGISHCASCDGPLFRGRVVAVVGGGDSALQEALTLANYAAHVLLLHRGAAFAAQAVYQRRVQQQPTIEVRYPTRVDAILGDQALTGIRVRDRVTDTVTNVAVAGLFIYVGLRPNTAFVADLLPLDQSGHIPTDIWMRTVLPGVFAAGDVRADSAAQAITAAGDGATAAIAAHRYLAERALSRA